MNSSVDLESKATTAPRLITSSKRARYLAGVSPSCRSGTTTGASLGRLMEFWFDREEDGVPGKAIPFREVTGSELCRNRDKLNKPPRLGRPEVEVDVRVESGRVGVGGTSSSGTLRKEPIVDDRPRASSLGGWPTPARD